MDPDVSSTQTIPQYKSKAYVKRAFISLRTAKVRHTLGGELDLRTLMSEVEQPSVSSKLHSWRSFFFLESVSTRRGQNDTALGLLLYFWTSSSAMFFQYLAIHSRTTLAHDCYHLWR